MSRPAREPDGFHRLDFVRAEVHGAGRVITEDAVARYHQGKAEVSGFTVAGRAVEGRTADALEQLRSRTATVRSTPPFRSCGAR